MRKSVNSENGINLQVNEQINKKAQNILLHASMNVQKVSDTKMVNRLRKQVLAELLHKRVVRNGVVDGECVTRFRNGDFFNFQVIRTVQGKQGTDPHPVTKVPNFSHIRKIKPTSCFVCRLKKMKETDLMSTCQILLIA